MEDNDLPAEGASRTPDARVAPPPAYVHVAPLDVDGVRTVEVGTILWGLAFVALLPFYSSLEEAGNVWWLWTCMAGLGLGLLGTEYCRRRRNRMLDASHTDGRESDSPTAVTQDDTGASGSGASTPGAPGSTARSSGGGRRRLV